MNKVLQVLVLVVMGGSAGWSATLVGWYRFDDSADLTKDSSGLNNHGTVVNHGGPPVYTSTGYTGGAADFQAAGKIHIPFNTGPNLWPNLTWGAWVKPRTTTGIHQIFNNDDGGYDRAIGIDNRAGNNFSAFVNNGPWPYNSGIAPSTNSWTFFAGVYENNFYGAGQGRLTLYVGNQVLQDIRTYYGATGWTFTALGGSPTFGEFWDGLIDNAFVIGGAANPTEMNQIMNNPDSIDTIAQSVVPEPSAASLFVLGIGGLVALRRCRRSAV